MAVAEQCWREHWRSSPAGWAACPGQLELNLLENFNCFWIEDLQRGRELLVFLRRLTMARISRSSARSAALLGPFFAGGAFLMVFLLVDVDTC